MNPGSNFYRQSNNINIGNIRIVIKQCYNDRMAIFALALTALLNFVQDNDRASFESHPVLMIIALSCLLVCCLSYDFKVRISATPHPPGYTYFLNCCIALFGPLSLAALSSTLFPSSVSPYFFAISVLFSLCQVPLSLVRTLWNRLRANFRQEEEQTTRGLSSVLRLPWISEPATENLVNARPPV